MLEVFASKEVSNKKKIEFNIFNLNSPCTISKPLFVSLKITSELSFINMI